MPPLSNARHERFAQELAKGKTQEQAYIDAGYEPDNARSQASRLMSTNANISARVAEIQGKAAKKVELTLADIIEELQEARELSRVNGQGAAMVSASKAKAELLGLGAAKKIELGGADGGPLQVQMIERRIVDSSED